jgi:hypothetical protein
MDGLNGNKTRNQLGYQASGPGTNIGSFEAKLLLSTMIMDMVVREAHKHGNRNGMSEIR